MKLYHWRDAPGAVRAQVGRVTAALAEVLGPDLEGIYLHGSLAMGCFNPKSSDIDLLVVTWSALPDGTRRALAGRLLDLSGEPSPLELSVLSEADLKPWRFPTPFQFHFSEGWRERFIRALAGGQWPVQPPTDPDLAAHITILHHRGIALWGPPVSALFPPVPPADYLAAIWEHDTRQVSDWLMERPVYGVLNLCRVLAYVSQGLIASKEEGGRWVLTILPAEHRPVVEHALACYRGEVEEAAFPPGAVACFAAFMGAAIESLIRSAIRGK